MQRHERVAQRIEAIEDSQGFWLVCPSPRWLTVQITLCAGLLLRVWCWCWRWCSVLSRPTLKFQGWQGGASPLDMAGPALARPANRPVNPVTGSAGQSDGIPGTSFPAQIRLAARVPVAVKGGGEGCPGR